MSRTLSIVGYVMFCSGIGIFLLNTYQLMRYVVPVLMIGGICIVILSVFLSDRDPKNKEPLPPTEYKSGSFEKKL